MMYGRLTVNPVHAAWNTVARFDGYGSAQRAVDRLSDDGFPVEQLDIVGSDLQMVERVTGRLTKWRAAAAGTVVFWRVRRRRRAAAPAAWMEASRSLCIGVSLLAGRAPGLAGLAAPDRVGLEPGDEPKVPVS
jgi:hypothetical protein